MKRRYAPSVWVCGLVLLWPLYASTAAIGQTLTDAQEKINNLLSGKPFTTKERVTQKEETECKERCFNPKFGGECVQVCTKRKVDVIETYRDQHRLTSAQAVSVPALEVDKSRLQGFPETAHAQVQEVINCSNTPSNQQLTFTQTATENVTVTKTQSVKTGANIKTGLSFGIQGWGKGDVSFTVSRDVSVTDTSAEGSSNTVTRSRSDSKVAPPLSISAAEFILYESPAELPYSGTVIIDGPLATNLEGKTSLSQILSESERTLNVSGVVRISPISHGTLRWRKERPVTAEDCGDDDKNDKVIKNRSMSLTIPVEGRSTLMMGAEQSTPSIIRTWEKSSLRNTRKIFSGGTPGAWCYTGPCNSPPDGSREECTFDDEGACTSCYDVSDSVCDPPADNGNAGASSNNSGINKQ